jgi:hypothetical protein
MSFFRDKNTGNSNNATVLLDQTVTPVQDTAPTNDSKLWVDTSAQ